MLHGMNTHACLNSSSAPSTLIPVPAMPEFVHFLQLAVMVGGCWRYRTLPVMSQGIVPLNGTL